MLDRFHMGLGSMVGATGITKRGVSVFSSGRRGDQGTQTFIRFVECGRPNPARFNMNKIKADRRHPKLKAKAAQARRLLPFTLELVTECRGADGELGEARYNSVKELSFIYEKADQRALSDQDLAQWRWAAAAHMFYYVSCGFHIYPKHHYFMHLPGHAAHIIADLASP